MPDERCCSPRCRGKAVTTLPWCIECWDRLPQNLREWFLKAKLGSRERTRRRAVLEDHLKVMRELEGR